MSETIKTYIVIPHYIISDSVMELAINTINSFRRTLPEGIIVSIDDGSEYDTTKIKELSDVFIRNEKNLGFAGAVNVGFKYVLDKNEDCNIVCSNNDIEVYPNWLEHFEYALGLSGGEFVGGLGFKSKVIFGKPIEEYDKNPGSYFTDRSISVGGRYKDWMFPGGLYMVKSSALRKIGLLDEGFLHGGYEDIDLFYRAGQAGMKLVITPRVAYWHKEGATRFSEEEKGKQNNVEPHNLQHFIDKWGFNPHKEMYQKIFIDQLINF